MRWKSADLRQQVVAGAAELIARRGLRATSIRELARYAKAPLGSTYHYFPGGKQQLAVEAVYHKGAQVHASLSTRLNDGPVALVEHFVALAHDLVVTTDFLGGCPVLAVAVEGADGESDPPALNAAAEVFTLWQQVLTDSFREHGVAEKQATHLATLVVAAIEGGVAMCRAKRSIEPLDNLAQPLLDLVTATIPGDSA